MVDAWARRNRRQDVSVDLRSGAGPRSSSPVVGTGDVLSGRVEIVGPRDGPRQPGRSDGSRRRPRPDPPPAGRCAVLAAMGILPGLWECFERGGSLGCAAVTADGEGHL